MLSTADPQENLRTITDLTARGADVVVFPEAAMCAFSGPVADAAEPLDGPWARQVESLAAAHEVTLVTGMFTPAPDGGKALISDALRRVCERLGFSVRRPRPRTPTASDVHSS
nr:hypothetical protein StreXyl84_66370 [Streptomyces sp. Xyl84]